MPAADKQQPRKVRRFAPMAARHLALLLAASLVVGSAGATRADDFAWWVVKQPKQTPSKASLIYGSTEDIDTTTFFLLCDTKRKTTQLDVGAQSESGEDGKPVTIEIEAGSAKTSLPAKTATDDGGNFVYRAESFAVKPVLAILQSPGDGWAKGPGISQSLPENGRAEAVSEFAMVCKLD
jgi:hypothetical protein